MQGTASGFSLVEFGMVMIISGLLVAAAGNLYASYLKRAKLEISFKRLHETNRMVADTWRIESRYLCPADPTLSPADPNYGREDCALSVAPGSCTGGTTGVCASTGRDVGGGQTRVLAGMLPFRDISDKFIARQEQLTRQVAEATDPGVKEELRQALNRAKRMSSLSAKDMAFDGWGRQFTYVVSAAWTVAMPDDAPVLRTGGSVIVKDDQGAIVAPLGAHFALISHGMSGDGAYDSQGKVFGKACADLGPLEQENCNGDAVVVRPPVQNWSGSAAQTDDLVAFNVTASNEVWERVACGVDDKDFCLRNLNARNVSVGGVPATEKLTVGGMMRANTLKLSGNSMCDADGGNCVSPEYIGGALLAPCPTGKVAKMVKGLGANGLSLECVDEVVPARGSGCAANEVLYGITAGAPDCMDPCKPYDGTVDTKTSSCPTGMSGTVTCEARYSCTTRSYSPYECTDTCTYQAVNGQCGAANGSSVSSAPTANLCTVGSASSVSGSGPWSWSCSGLYGGANATCSADKPVDGVCGSGDGAVLASPPTGASACSVGSSSAPSGSNPYFWTCGGTGGGATANCSSALPTTVNGSCGSANGGSYASAPSTSLCSTGTASSVSGSGPWSWTCSGSGTPVGSSDSCSATKIVPGDGACGTANNNTNIYSMPTSYTLCSAGTASAVADTGSGWTWTCYGTSGGTDASCGTDKRVDGVCGSANGGTYVSAPSSNLCASGSASGVGGSGPWSWYCWGAGSGPTASCSANKSSTENGACGSANGGTFATAPSSNLCSAGSPSGVSGSGPWSWSCNGTGTPAGTNASCSANKVASVNGSCGSANNSCNAGSPIGYNAGSCGGYATWTCAGSGGGADASCSVAAACAPVNGSCGAANNTCNAGSPTGYNAGSCGGSATWTCAGSGGGSNASCSTPNAACAVNGSCGAANNTCNAGSPTGYNAGSCGGSATWTCAGSGGGSNASCSNPNAACAVNGSCGAANNTCNAGSPTGYNAGSCGGSATWTCNGSGGGSNASCSKANAACAVNGSCGGSANTCLSGSASGYNAGSCGGSQTWTCNGSGGGSNASCSIANAPCSTKTWQYWGQYGTTGALIFETFDMNCGPVTPAACTGCTSFPAVTCTPGAACGNETKPCLINGYNCTMSDGNDAFVWDRYECQ